ncbi:MAG: 4a-hydroxytetrahydrobiopterin dehydratase [bacterium]
MENKNEAPLPLAEKRCIPCEDKNAEALLPHEAEALMSQIDAEWMLIDDAHILARQCTFKNFKDALAFVNKVGDIAEEEGHHPDMTLSWGSVGIELSTHALSGLSENDFILASKVDQIKL